MNSPSISSPSVAARPLAQSGADRRGGPSAAVAFEGVSRSYGRVLALDGVDPALAVTALRAATR